MTYRIDCPACRAAVDVGRLQRGRAVACPACRAPVDVPDSLDFRTGVREALADRRVGNRALLFALLATATCIATPVCAAVWWWTSRRIGAAVDECRVPAEPLLAARVVAAVGFAAQIAFWWIQIAAR